MIYGILAFLGTLASNYMGASAEVGAMYACTALICFYIRFRDF